MLSGRAGNTWDSYIPETLVSIRRTLSVVEKTYFALGQFHGCLTVGRVRWYRYSVGHIPTYCTVQPSNIIPAGKLEISW